MSIENPQLNNAGIEQENNNPTEESNKVEQVLSAEDKIKIDEAVQEAFSAANWRELSEVIRSVDARLHRSLALALIKAGQSLAVTKQLDNFTGLDKEVALVLIKANHAEAVAEHLKNFTGLDHKEIAQEMIKANQAYAVAAYLKNFTGLDHKKIAQEIIKANHAEAVAAYLKNFIGLDHKEIALAMIKAKQDNIVAAFLENFSGLDEEVATAMINTNHAKAVARNLKNFSGLNKRVALNLIAADYANKVAEHFKSFNGLNHKEIALIMVKGGQAEAVAKNIGNFDDIDHQEIILTMIMASQSEVAAKYLKIFTGLDHNRIAMKMMNELRVDVVAKYLSNFTGLDKKVAYLLYKAMPEYEKKVDENEASFAGEWLEQVHSRHLKISESFVLQDQADEDLTTSPEQLYSLLSEKSDYWQDKVNVAEPFKAGAEAFGYDNMFKFIDRPGLSRHDALHNFQQVLEVWQASGLPAQTFYHNILEQVQADGADYGELGSAHGKFNNLVNSISLDFNATITEAQEFKAINRLQTLLQGIKSPEQIFSSWKMLLKYEEICDLLKRRELLEQLQSLPKVGKEKLFNYVETLAFHPNIAMPAVMKFWQDIDGFLAIGDSHTPRELQNRKKPSNYINFPNLDLTGEELRDALVEGHYDKIQAFAPLSIEYDIFDKKTEQTELSLAEQIFRAVGKRSEGIKGHAKNPAKLFSQLTKLFKRYDIKLVDYLRSQQPDEDFPEAELVKEEARILLADKDMGLQEKTSPRDHYRAKINLKSDPDGVVAGNDTACCMPFGSGKNNVYTFNPVCSLFTLQRKTADGKWRTVAQSVLTRNIDIKKNIADLVDEMENNKVKMTELVDDELLSDQSGIITCDNIEVAKNFQGHDDIIKTIYSDFFREYIQQAGGDWDKDKLIIGMGYTDAMTSLPDIDNTFIPEAPVGYSDNLHKQSYILDLKKKENELAFKKKIVNKIEPITEPEQSTLPKGIKFLTFHDALPVSYIEGKAYASNDSLMEYLHNMENALIAKDVNNIAKNRPNMSIKYEDTQGKMHGYLLGYEGRLDKDGEAIIYVSDLASDGNKRAGGSLILGFAQLYKEHYLDKDNLLPIYAQMRDQTSYEIIKKQLDKLAGQLGIKFVMEEKGTYQSGGDTMHEVVLWPVKEG